MTAHEAILTVVLFTGASLCTALAVLVWSPVRGLLARFRRS